jgi:hypothetical protein
LIAIVIFVVVKPFWDAKVNNWIGIELKNSIREKSLLTCWTRFCIWSASAQKMSPRPDKPKPALN